MHTLCGSLRYEVNFKILFKVLRIVKKHIFGENCSRLLLGHKLCYRSICSKPVKILSFCTCHKFLSSTKPELYNFKVAQ